VDELDRCLPPFRISFWSDLTSCCMPYAESIGLIHQADGGDYIFTPLLEVGYDVKANTQVAYRFMLDVAAGNVSPVL